MPWLLGHYINAINYAFFLLTRSSVKKKKGPLCTGLIVIEWRHHVGLDRISDINPKKELNAYNIQQTDTWIFYLFKIQGEQWFN